MCSSDLGDRALPQERAAAGEVMEVTGDTWCSKAELQLGKEGHLTLSVN